MQSQCAAAGTGQLHALHTSRRLLCLLVTSALLLLGLMGGLSRARTFAGPGSGSGQVDRPVSIGIDQADGTVYVADEGNHRVDEFTAVGEFLRAFGWGVVNGAEELQTCISSCQSAFHPGSDGSAPGDIRPWSLAVDSSGDAYVTDYPNNRVEKYDQQGHLLLLFGKEVDKGGGTPAHPGDVCTAEYLLNGDSCGVGAPTGPGSIPTTAPLAMDPSGNLWVGGSDVLEKFSSQGEFLSEISVPGVGMVRSLGIDSVGNFYLIGSEASGIDKLKPDGTPYSSPYPLDSAGHPNAIGLDPNSDDLFISDQANPNAGISYGSATLLEFDSSGAQTEAFAAGEVAGGPKGNALAFHAGSVYVADGAGEAESQAQVFAEPQPGPLPVFGTTKAIEIQKTAVTFCAQLNPEGASSTARFQYVTAARFSQNEAEGNPGFTGALETPESSPLGEGFSFGHELCQAVSGLTPATGYRFRLFATNANGAVPGDPATTETLPPAAIDSTSASDISADAATLEAEINPLGDPTSYRFEFLPEAAFRQNQEAGEPPFAGALQAPLSPVQIGSGNIDVSVSQHLQGLQPATPYRYRVAALNPVSELFDGGSYFGPDHTFKTQLLGAPSILLDGRAWELVSPPEKHGAAITPINEEGLVQAADSGDSITYLASAPTEAEPPGNSNFTQVISARGPQGWHSQDITPPHQTATGVSAATGNGQEYRSFSADLSHAVIQPFGPFNPLLSPAASEQTPYLRTNFPVAESTLLCSSSCLTPVVTAAPGFEDVPPGTEFGHMGIPFFSGPVFAAGSPDLRHLALYSEAALAPGAPTGIGGLTSLYEYSANRPASEALRLLSILPDGKPAAPSSHPVIANEGGAAVDARGAISADGSRVVWSTSSGNHHLYVRVNATEPQSTVSGSGECLQPGLACTVQLDPVQEGASGTGESQPLFQFASADGSRLFFTDQQRLTADSGSEQGKPDLYECELTVSAGAAPRCQLTDLTPQRSGEVANVKGAVIGASEDGAYLYFVADGVLASNSADNGNGPETAQPGNCRSGQGGNPGTGNCNLYLQHEGITTFLATLSGADSPDWAKSGGDLTSLTARVSPNGHWLAFMSQRQLTGYDSRDAVSGQPDQEVFLYHAAAEPTEEGKLACASCNPTGARPRGVEYSQLDAGNGGLAGGDRIWAGNQWIAANLPGWTPYKAGLALYQSRYLSDSGRLFFNSSGALVPSDTNGAGDVYEYEPPGVGSCTEADRTFDGGRAGCVALISSGASGEESAFLDASESGADVFFLTHSRLVSQDRDTALDVYDAHVCTAAVPCPPPPGPSPVECEGDGCQQPAVPANDPTPGSLTFQGAGNLLECPHGKQLRGRKCLVKKHGRTHKKHHKGKHKRAANTIRRASR